MKYRKLPVVIEAVKINQESGCFEETPAWLREAIKSCEVDVYGDRSWLIRTLEDGPNGEAKHIADPGDYIIRGVQGELYFCKPDIFKKTYEAANF